MEPAIESPDQTPRPTVSVVGLGPMGTALAQALLTADLTTTVWNRTTSRAEALDPAGATVAPDFRSAVERSDLVVTVLRDHATTRELLASVAARTFEGRTVVVLASSTPDEARRTQAWADDAGIQALIGAVMVPTPLVGGPDALVLYSGRGDLHARHRAVLERLAPHSPFVGADPGLAALLDTAMLEIFFAGMTAFLHAGAMVTAQGLRATEFVPWAQQMLAILPNTVAGLAQDMDAGTYPGTEDNIAMELAALRHMEQASDDLGIDSRLPALMRGLAETAVARGHGDESWSRVVDVLRDGAASRDRTAQGPPSPEGGRAL